MALIERTPEAYAAAFERERKNEYPIIDEFERRMGYAVDRERLEAAARVLACPVKKNPPNWQHGRLVYALGKRVLSRQLEPSGVWLDVGTAKGFSALCMAWALADAGAHYVPVFSFDVIDPESREPRNSVEDGKTIDEFVQPFMPEGENVFVDFQQGSLAIWAKAVNLQASVRFAFIDGSHQYDNVKSDISIVTPRQQSGDIILFDDLQKSDVARAVSELQGYDLEYIEVLPTRKYAIAVKQ